MNKIGITIRALILFVYCPISQSIEIANSNTSQLGNQQNCKPAELLDIHAIPTDTSIEFTFTASQPIETIFAQVNNLTHEKLFTCHQMKLCKVSGLSPCTEYSIYLKLTSCKTSIHAGRKKIMTKLGIPPKPMQVYLQSLPRSTMKITWKSGFSNICSANISYSLNWHEIDQINELNKATTLYENFTFQSKSAYQKFNICIVTNSYEKSRLTSVSEPLCIISNYSSPGLPSKPHILNYTLFDNEILIQFGLPDNPNGNIDYLQFCVEYYEKYPKYCCNHLEWKNNKSNEFLVTNLSICTHYKIKLKAINIDFDGFELIGKETILEFDSRSQILTPPSNLYIIKVNDTSVSLIWNPISTSCTHNFIFQIKSVSNCRFDNFNLKSNQTILHLNNLKPYTTYEILYSVETLAGIGLWKHFRVSTGYAKPQEANFTSDSCDNQSCEFQLHIPSQLTGPTGYSVYANHTRMFNTLIIKRLNESCTTRQIPIKVSNLRANTKYVFEFTAMVVNVSEQIKNKIEVMTKPADPEKPEEVKVDCNFNETKGILYWKKPKEVDGVLMSFLVTFKGIREGKIDHIEQNLMPVLEHKKLHYAITVDLKPDYFYIFKIKAKNFNVENLGPEAEISCYKKALLAPEVRNEQFNSSHVISFKPTEVNISLNEELFSDSNGIIVNYSIILYQQDSNSNLTPLFWSDMENKNNIFPYVTTPDNWNPFKNKNDSEMCCENTVSAVQCRIGCNVRCSQITGSCNGPLRPNTQYKLIVKAYTSAGFNETKPISFTTRNSSNSHKRNDFDIVFRLIISIVIILMQHHSS